MWCINENKMLQATQESINRKQKKGSFLFLKFKSQAACNTVIYCVLELRLQLLLDFKFRI